MKLSELEVICIKNVVRDSNSNFSIDSYEDFRSNPQYADLINNVDIDINQAIARLVTSEKVLTDEFEIPYIYNPKEKRNNLYIELDEYINPADIYKVRNVEFYDTKGRMYLPKYVKTAKKLILTIYPINGNYRVVYSKNVPYLDHTAHGDKDLFEEYGINDTIINSYVLNFVKSKLWESEEPELAQSYMNYAETYLDAYTGGDDVVYQSEVQIDYDY